LNYKLKTNHYSGNRGVNIPLRQNRRALNGATRRNGTQMLFANGAIAEITADFANDRTFPAAGLSDNYQLMPPHE
jgi:hypothetical protein